jgi:exodeoxyribonuclease-1
LSTPSIFWHDYETWGANPQKDHPCQFAGIRTDHELNIIGKPVNWFCQIPNDYLPHPQACLITGITPQQSIRDGMIEAEFIKKIAEQFNQHGTCGAGYNSLRFDDEISRYTFYRNFHDPYAREWKNGNSRWDIIDLVRTCYALRPEGIVWPEKEDGSPSFKLEDLAKANDLGHESAHDAMSDVYATIALAKLVKDKQPKLYDYLFQLRDKNKIVEQLNFDTLTPYVHISSKLPALNGCATWIVPIAFHPNNKNAVIVVNLALDTEPLFDLSVEQLRNKLYQPTSMLKVGEQRIGLKLIHINKCPVIAPAKSITQDNAQRLGLDREQCLAHLKRLQNTDGLRQKLVQVFDQIPEPKSLDADHSLYSGGFFSHHDRQLMDQIIAMGPYKAAEQSWPFEDTRLKTLFFRYRARNTPTLLDYDESQRWQQHRKFRLLDPASPASIKLSEYMLEIEQLLQRYSQDSNKTAILNALVHYAENL